MEENVGEAPKSAEPVLSTYLQCTMKCCKKIVGYEVCVKAWFNNQDAYTKLHVCNFENYMYDIETKICFFDDCCSIQLCA